MKNKLEYCPKKCDDLDNFFYRFFCKNIERVTPRRQGQRYFNR